MNPGLVVKLRPSGPWRIGPDSGARNRVDAIYHSDSLYSAITSAMARLGSLEEWLEATARSAEPAVCFSSCFPFLDDIGFVVPPRTIWPPTSPALMSARVRWKSARFVPLGIVQAILSGKRLDENQWTVDGASECLVPAGKPGPFRTGVRSSAAVDRLSGATERHSTACMEFRPGAGLWTVAGFTTEAAQQRWLDPVKAAFRLLADSGFGGERSRGWGRSESPEFIEGVLPDMILAPITRPVKAEVRAPSPVLPAVAPKAEPVRPPAEVAVVTEPPAEAATPAAEPAEPEATVVTELGAEVAPLEAEASPATPEGEAPGATESATEVAPVSTESAEAGEPDVPEPTAEAAPTEAEASPAAPQAEATAATEPEPAELEVPATPEPTAEVEPEAEASPGTSEPETTATEPANEPEVPATPEPTAELAPEGEASSAASEAEATAVEPESAEPEVPATPERTADGAPVAEAEAAAEPQPAAEAAPAPPSPTAQKTYPHWLLSLFTPAAADTVDWSRGNYTVLARGGRVDSPAGSGELKKQLQMVSEGSVVYAVEAPSGAAPDVAPDGFAHPVFRAGFALSIRLPEGS